MYISLNGKGLSSGVTDVVRRFPFIFFDRSTIYSITTILINLLFV